jgi:hypothetical protein
MTSGAILPTRAPPIIRMLNKLSLFSLSFYLYTVGMLRFCTSTLSSECVLTLIDYQIYWEEGQPSAKAAINTRTAILLFYDV